MAQVMASATRTVSAAPGRVLAVLRDYGDARRAILTDAYSDYRVENGDDVISYRFKAGGREREYRLRGEVVDGGLVERDELSSYVQRWTVVETATGSTVTLEASWHGAGGIGGFFERLFAPLGLRRIFNEVLDRLATAVQSAE
jgi:hypothetical protein